MQEMHLRQPGFTYSDCGPFFGKRMNEKNLKEHESQDIFIKMN